MKISKSILKALKHTVIWDFVTLLSSSPDLTEELIQDRYLSRNSYFPNLSESIMYKEMANNRDVGFSVLLDRGPP